LTIENKTINVYFCVNLFKIETNEAMNTRPLFNELQIEFNKLKCNMCSLNQGEDCESYFDYRKLFSFQSVNSNDVKNTQIELYCSQFNIIQSQDINFSKSILDSLEENGYFGNISFQAVIQRVYKKELKSNLLK
jgi:viroplasmin and RNaseH domain-containing protein